ncbi:uncharacterized protein HMPREF1541_02755 [Cyphellophora europaea CBS 101466]|uniref:DUF7779 domain-containing protein n=1 Tax=Cyphellophora europaea (strain CBS 101466) TaxID=1220924 RepID=W2S4G5_CYPE1|nr:uncharacterized protein HMPREF1541_02755 [Cyphellophora europaea CBS 101466]ETN43596.1 hypothetical protein HMPREF1541_02755 [Cyphellophora europaea CBS 101466]
MFQMLSTIYKYYYDVKWNRWMPVLSGACFLGTPHSSDTDRSKPKLNLILRMLKLSTKVLCSAEKHSSAFLSSVCSRFNEVGGDIGDDMRIMSVFEESKTKIRDHVFKATAEVLVDRLFAEIGARREILLGAAADHRLICDLSNSQEALQALRTMVRDALTKKDHFASRNEVQEDGSSGFENPWVSTSSVIEIAEATDWQHNLPVRSGQATRGSGSTEHLSASFEPVPPALDVVEDGNPVLLPCYLLDSWTRNPAFKGRQELMREIDQALLPENQDVRRLAPFAPLSTFVLCGMGGSGKTEIATEYAFTRQHLFDAVFLVNASTTAKLAERFSQIATKLGLITTEEAIDRGVARMNVLKWLSDPKRSIKPGPDAGEGQDVEEKDPVRWLLVFDNADDPRLLTDYWPSAGSGSVLVTSRDSVTQRHLDAPNGTTLGGLADDEGAALLQQVTHEKDESADFSATKEISRRFLGYPLALKLVAAMLRRRDLTFSEFLRAYPASKAIKDLYEPGLPLLQDAYGHNMSTVWSPQDFSARALDLLGFLALLDPDRVDEELIVHAISAVKSPHFFTDEADYLDARTDLLKASLIQRDKTAGRLTIHRLVQEAAIFHFPTGRLGTMISLVIDVLAAKWPYPEDRYTHDPELFNDFETVAPHIAKLQVLYNQNNSFSMDFQTMRKLCELLQQGGWYLTERGNFDESLEMFKTALRICETYPDKMEELLADCLFCIGDALSETNEPAAALEYAKRHYDVRLNLEKDRSKPSLYGALAYSELGNAQMLNGLFEEGIENCKSARAIQFKDQEFLDGTYWPYFSTIQMALCLSALGRSDEAVPLLQETIDWGIKFYGPKPRTFKQGFAYYALGNVYEDLQLTDEAYNCHRQALDILFDTRGKHFHRTGTAYLKMAEHANRLYEYEAAK